MFIPRILKCSTNNIRRFLSSDLHGFKLFHIHTCSLEIEIRARTLFLNEKVIEQSTLLLLSVVNIKKKEKHQLIVNSKTKRSIES